MTDIPSELSLDVGDRHVVVLPGLGTAGYRWDEDVAGDSDVVSIEWRRGLTPDEARGRPVGASAPERVAITAAAPGHVTVKLRQQRPWENGPPRAEHTIEVDVRPPAGS